MTLVCFKVKQISMSFIYIHGYITYVTHIVVSCVLFVSDDTEICQQCHFNCEVCV